MQSEVGKEILYEMTTEFQASLSFCTFALVNYISVIKPYNKLLIDLACSVL